MLIVVSLALAWAVWEGGRAAWESLRGLPRRNEDMVFW